MKTLPNQHAKKNHRVESGITRGKKIDITVDGQALTAYEGETVGAVLAATGIRTIRRSHHLKDPRGLYCCVGTCHSCLVTVDGKPNMRACLTKVQPGQQITLQEGLGKIDINAPEPSAGRLIRQTPSILVIGSGPAGLSAAIAAAKLGADVLVVDENLRAGGQIYRQLPKTYDVKDPVKLGVDYVDGQALLKQAHGLSDRITLWNDALVWSVFDSRQCAVARNDDLLLIDAKAIVIATGAYERPFPVPGWTLPGVMTAGGAQVLLKNQYVRPGRRVLLAGTGPLQLAVANQMLDVGIEVVAVAESASIRNAWRYLPELVHQPGLIKQGLKYIYRLRRSGVHILHSHVLRAIEGEQQAQRAILGKVDSRCRPIFGNTKTFDVDTVCIGYGLIPLIWLTAMLGCKHLYHPLVGSWVPYFDENMQTDQPGVFVAGDGAGIAGVLAARRQGTIAGLFAAAHAGIISTEGAVAAALSERKPLASLQTFRRGMDHICRIYPDLYANITDDTIVCRCENITAGEIRNAAQAGPSNLNDIKKRTRSGMGYCQGSHCMPVIAAMLAREFGVNAEDIQTMTTRPPARPIALNLLMVDLAKDSA